MSDDHGEYEKVQWVRLHNTLWQIQLGLMIVLVLLGLACFLLWKIYDAVDVN